MSEPCDRGVGGRDDRLDPTPPDDASQRSLERGGFTVRIRKALIRTLGIPRRGREGVRPSLGAGDDDGPPRPSEATHRRDGVPNDGIQDEDGTVACSRVWFRLHHAIVPAVNMGKYEGRTWSIAVGFS
jgi:hypothetical protein